MSKERKRFKAEYKAKIAIEVIKETKTVNQLTQENNLHPNQISLWKKELVNRAGEIFGSVKDKEKIKNEQLVTKLYQEIRSTKSRTGLGKKN